MKIRNIVLAVGLIKTDKDPIDRALELAKQFEAKIILVHAIEHIVSYGTAYGIAMGTEIEESLFEGSTKEMQKLGKKTGIPEEDQIIKFGSAKFVIIEEAQRLHADLIIVGSHGRHGIRLLLGSTANGVLHEAPCDVLAVRINEK